MRTSHGEYPEYHTSADSLDFIKPQSLGGSLRHCLAVFNVLEHNHRYMNQNPKCEPQLGKRGMYSSRSGASGQTVAGAGFAVGVEPFGWQAFAA